VSRPWQARATLLTAEPVTAQLHRLLHQVLRQSIEAQDKRHLSRLSEMLYALLLSGSALLADWLSYRQMGRNPKDSRAALQR
jgi:hypothetical protein